MNDFYNLLASMRNMTIEIMNLMSSSTNEYEKIVSMLQSYTNCFAAIENFVPREIYSVYKEFFDAFSSFGNDCSNKKIFEENVDELSSSLELVIECLNDLEEKCKRASGICSCCGKEVFYTKLPDYYREQAEKYKCKPAIDETLNAEKYLCPNCSASDRDRLIVSFLKKIGLDKADDNTSVLQVAPAGSIHSYIKKECPQIFYRTTDLFMDGVDYKSDIQDLKEIPSGKFDVIICSHVLEHVQNDDAALQAMKRVLKDDGRIVFLVPVDLSIDKIDEEWGCSEAENWRRFGQGDHCRKYSRNGLIERLEKHFCVHKLGKGYFGKEVFESCGLSETSTLYVLTKGKDINLDIVNKQLIDIGKVQNGPLVSVVLPCYNHAPFVAEAIESVLNQTYKNIEFIIGDDASTDETPEIIKRYSSNYAHEIYYTNNLGGRDRELTQLATGKYVALMHSDDVWDVDKLAIQVSYMENHPECGACFTWCDYVDEDLNRISNNIFIQPNRSREEWIKFFWDKGNALCNPSSLIRRELCQNIDFYGCEVRQVPDMFKWVNMVLKNDIYIIPKCLTFMRRYNKNGVTNTSAFNSETVSRTLLEYGITWLPIIRNMSSEMFVKAFLTNENYGGDLDDIDILCEKFLLMLKSTNVFLQQSALYFYIEFNEEARTNLQNKYNYSVKDFRADELGKGLASFVRFNI